MYNPLYTFPHKTEAHALGHLFFTSVYAFTKDEANKVIKKSYLSIRKMEEKNTYMKKICYFSFFFIY